ncbi:FliH/SctL family protein [Anaerovorax odorimutans]|uniref:FliH/SctL family protein n=1 Tax=Anaerovorax odorimutans TaxID=109327 RepID=UPI00041E26DC|nr:FliH/SctL family protein [Anaerovorax odorimutans]
MILLPSFIDSKTGTPRVVPYSFSSDLTSDMESSEEALDEENSNTNEEKNEDSEDNLKLADQIIEDSKKKAAEILEEAEKKAEKILLEAEEKGYKEGLAKGRIQGEEIAVKENKLRLEKESEKFLQELKQVIADLERKKEELIDKQYDELCNLVLIIAEKIIKISLKSSSEVITKMIISATEKFKNKEWARIHISNYEASLNVEGESEFLEAIGQISPHVKVVFMENEQPGTCIIELPDQIIDASVDTQLENIKEILDESKHHGGE